MKLPFEVKKEKKKQQHIASSDRFLLRPTMENQQIFLSANGRRLPAARPDPTSGPTRSTRGHRGRLACARAPPAAPGGPCWPRGPGVTLRWMAAKSNFAPPRKRLEGSVRLPCKY